MMAESVHPDLMDVYARDSEHPTGIIIRTTSIPVLCPDRAFALFARNLAAYGVAAKMTTGFLGQPKEMIGWRVLVATRGHDEADWHVAGPADWSSDDYPTAQAAYDAICTWLATRTAG